MNPKISTKNMAIKKVIIRKIISLLSNTSDKNLIRASYLLEKLAHKQDKPKIKKVRELLKHNHSSVNFIKSILTNYDPNCVNKFLNNFIIKGLVIDSRWRDEQIISGKNAPFTLLISPTMRCNLNCTGCYANRYGKKDDLSYDLLDRVIKESMEFKTALFTILGGEPFIRNDIFELFEKHNDLYFQVYTNGTLIDEEVCQKLKKAGNIFPQISIEGFEKETDERRGKGIYNKILSSMDMLKKHRIPFGFSVCVTSKNQEAVFSDKFVDLMVEKGALIGWYFLFMPVCGNPDMSLMPTPEQRVDMFERCNYIRDNKPIFIIDFWNDAPFVMGCIAGKYYAHITSKGDVEPCIFTHFSVDNIKNKSLKECLNSDYFRALRKKQPYSENLLLPCQWIDHPEVSREMYKKFNLKPTHPGAEDILTDVRIKKQIDEYSEKVKKIYSPIWEKKFLQNKESLWYHKGELYNKKLKVRFNN